MLRSVNDYIYESSIKYYTLELHFDNDYITRLRKKTKIKWHMHAFP